MLGLCSSPKFEDHDTGPHHPERPSRIRAIHRAIADTTFTPSLVQIDPTPANETWLLTVHPTHHVQHVKTVCAAGGVLDQGDTPVEPRSFETALFAAGAGLNCCDAVMSGQVRRAFAAVRPPGHHAEPDRAMGFCLFNNIAIAARYLQQHHQIARVAIVDFDVHHGNGTQAAFDADPTVLFISTHQHPSTCYPGTGYDWEIGSGAGRGFTLNIPMQPGGGDDEYLDVLKTRVIPRLDEFRPEILLFSAGFDAHRDDPLAQMEVSDEGFEQITRELIAVANNHCDGRIVSLLEGGYNLNALGRSVVRHLQALNEF